MHRVHAWLGYGVAGVIVVRMLLVATGSPQLVLMQFYPHFEGLKLGTALTHPAISRSLLVGIAVCTIGTVGTGVWMDQGRTFGMGAASGQAVPAEAATGPAVHESDEHESDEQGSNEHKGARRGEGGHEEEEAVEEVHELLANLLLALVGANVTYLILFKRPLARFMAFLPKARRRKDPD